MSMCSRFLRFGMAAVLAFSWNASVLSDQAHAAPRKAKHHLKSKHKALKKKKKKQLSKTTIIQPEALPVQTAAPIKSAAPVETPPMLSGPTCPAPGNVGIYSAAEWTSVISNNLGRTIEVCNDLEFESNPDEVASGFSGRIPGEWMNGFQGVLEGNGHTIKLSAGPTARAISLRIEFVLDGAIQNLIIEGQGDTPLLYPGYVLAEYATNATFRNIQLKNISTASGLVYRGVSSRFEQVAGNIALRPAPTQRIAGGLAQTCEDCSVSDSRLEVNMISAEGSTGASYPTYVGGLIGYAHSGSLQVRNVMLSGALRRGYDRGMIIGAMDGSPIFPDGVQPELIIDGVRVTNADLTEHSDVRSYTVGSLVGRASLPTTVTRTLVRNARIEADQQAGGLIGGGYALTASEVAVHGVSVRAGGAAGGMLGWNSGNANIEDSYFDGSVEQSGEVLIDPFPLFAAGGILGFATNADSIRRVYVNARVSASNANNAGAVVGADSGPAGLSSLTTEHVYFNRSLANQFTPAVAQGLSAEEMLQPASFAGFGDNEWLLKSGSTPRLRNRPLFGVQDLFDFLSLYFAQDARADIDGSGTISVEDLFSFLEMYHQQ